MDAVIHSVDTEHRESEGNVLHVRGTPMEFAVRRFEGLPFGEHKDQHYLELEASSWEGATKSTLTARLNAEELQQLVGFAAEARLIDPPVSRRVLELLEQLREELAVVGQRREKPQQ